MSNNAVEKKDKEVEQVVDLKTYKLTLTHKNHKELEMVVKEMLEKAKKIKDENKNIKISGPGRMPVKRLVITTRKSPCGNGTNTYDRFEMRIHKRVIHLECEEKNFSTISSIRTPAGMVIEAIELVSE